MLFPSDTKIKIAGTVFSVDEIDIEALRRSRFPQQTHFDIRVKTVDKKVRKSME